MSTSPSEPASPAPPEPSGSSRRSAPPPPSGPARPDIPPWQWWTAPAAVVFGLALGAVGTLVVETIGAVAGSSLNRPSAVVSIVGDVVFDLGFVAAALILVRSAGGSRPSDFGFRRVSPRAAVIAFVMAAFAYYVLTAIYASLLALHGKDKLPSELSTTHSTVAIALTAVFVCAVAPMCEEFFFRGFLFGTLRKLRVTVAGRDLGVWIAAIVTGLLFGAVHLGSASPQYLVPLGFLGFVLCLVRWKTGSLYPGMALHSANNALALGVNQLHWTAPEILGLTLAGWAVIAAVVGPLGVRFPRLA